MDWALSIELTEKIIGAALTMDGYMDSRGAGAVNCERRDEKRTHFDFDGHPKRI